MKKPIYLLLSILLLVSIGCSYKRIGSLTMLSTRNIDSSKNYVLLARDVEGESKMRRDDPLQEAIDNAVLSISGGEYMMNAVIYYKDDKKMKVRGDVYGIGIDINAPSDTSKCPFSPGEDVIWLDPKNRTVNAQIISCDKTTVQLAWGAGLSNTVTCPVARVRKKTK